MTRSRCKFVQHDYGGSVVHVLQIGLGTNSTFLHRDCDWIDVLLAASSRVGKVTLRGIGVDPVEECLEPLDAIARQLGGVSLVLAAISDSSLPRALFCLPRDARAQVHEQLKMSYADAQTISDVHNQMIYLENMSSIGTPHPGIQDCIKIVENMSGITPLLLEQRCVSCYTFEGLLKMHNASGCEVLIIDWFFDSDGIYANQLNDMCLSKHIKNVDWIQGSAPHNTT